MTPGQKKADRTWLERTELLLGDESLNKLEKSHVCVVGLGGVGSFAAEFLCRAGVGEMTIVDGDTVDSTNRNRQLPALHSTIGKSKALLMKERLLDINPDLVLHVHDRFLEPEDVKMVLQGGVDYVADCIDTISPKMNLIRICIAGKIPFISSMGAGGVTDPSKVKTDRLSKTFNCVMAQHMKKRLKKEGYFLNRIHVVFSTEMPLPSSMALAEGRYKKSYYGTISYIPALFGIHICGHIVKKLTA